MRYAKGSNATVRSLRNDALGRKSTSDLRA